MQVAEIDVLGSNTWLVVVGQVGNLRRVANPPFAPGLEGNPNRRAGCHTAPRASALSTLIIAMSPRKYFLALTLAAIGAAPSGAPARERFCNTLPNFETRRLLHLAFFLQLIEVDFFETLD